MPYGAFGSLASDAFGPRYEIGDGQQLTSICLVTFQRCSIFPYNQWKCHLTCAQADLLAIYN